MTAGDYPMGVRDSDFDVPDDRSQYIRRQERELREERQIDEALEAFDERQKEV